MNSSVQSGGVNSPQNRVLSKKLDERCSYTADIHTSNETSVENQQPEESVRLLALILFIRRRMFQLY